MLNFNVYLLSSVGPLFSESLRALILLAILTDESSNSVLFIPPPSRDKFINLVALSALNSSWSVSKSRARNSFKTNTIKMFIFEHNFHIVQTTSVLYSLNLLFTRTFCSIFCNLPDNLVDEHLEIEDGKSPMYLWME